MSNINPQLVRVQSVKVVDATNGEVIFALNDGTQIINVAMTYATACRFAGQLLNRADYFAQKGWNNILGTMDHAPIKQSDLQNAIRRGDLTIGQANRIYRKDTGAAMAESGAHD
jgi:hypothetical protein